MTRHQRKYHAAGTLMFVLAALYLLVAGLAFSAHGPCMVVAAALSAVLGLGLITERRWVAYFAFLGLIFGLSAALGGAITSFGSVAVLFWLIVVFDIVAAAVLFGNLWGQRPDDPI